MKIIPIITAILVLAGLYFAVFERDRLLDFAQGDQIKAGAVVATLAADT